MVVIKLDPTMYRTQTMAEMRAAVRPVARTRHTGEPGARAGTDPARIVHEEPLGAEGVGQPRSLC